MAFESNGGLPYIADLDVLDRPLDDDDEKNFTLGDLPLDDIRPLVPEVPMLCVMPGCQMSQPGCKFMKLPCDHMMHYLCLRTHIKSSHDRNAPILCPCCRDDSLVILKQMLSREAAAPAAAPKAVVHKPVPRAVVDWELDVMANNPENPVKYGRETHMKNRKAVRLGFTPGARRSGAFVRDY